MNIEDELLKLALKASKKNEIPVGAIIVKDNKIISKAINKRNSSNNVLHHAEVLAIVKATKKLKTWNLNNCILYVSLKPCKMCETIITQSRLQQVYYMVDKLEFKKEYNKTVYTKIKENNKTETYKELLADFFKKLR